MPAVELLTIVLHIQSARSLKDKRRVITSIKTRLRKLNVALAETNYNDFHKQAQLDILAVSTHRDGVDKILTTVLTEIDRHDPGLISSSELEWLT